MIAVIISRRVGLGFLNEYRTERTAEALHSRLRHEVVVTRAGRPVRCDVTELVPGDSVTLSLVVVVPGDLRLNPEAGGGERSSLVTRFVVLRPW